MMFSINVWMTLVIIVIIPVSFLSIRFITKHSQRYFLKQLEYKGSLNGQIEETFTGHDLIRAFNQEEISNKKFDEDNEKWYTHEWKSPPLNKLFLQVLIFCLIYQKMLEFHPISTPSLRTLLKKENC